MLSQCRPSSVAFVVGAMWVVALGCAHLPFLSDMVDLVSPLPTMVLSLVGGVFSCLACLMVMRARREAASIFLILDTVCYAFSALAMALLCAAPASYIFGGVMVIMALHWGQSFAFSYLGAVFVVVVPLAGAYLGGADLPLMLIVFMGGVFFVFVSRNTAQARRMAERDNTKAKSIEHLSYALLERHSAAVSELRIDHGVALHNVKNSLHPVLANIEFAIMAVEEGRWPMYDLEEARDGILTTSAQVIQQLGRLRSQEESGASFALRDLLGDLGSMHPGPPHGKEALRVREFSGDVRVRGSVENLRVVLHNLVGNAFEAGASTVEISASLDDDGRKARLLVSDDGPGIPRGIAADPFSPFVTAGKENGTGLGLFICKSLVESLGGSVRVASTGPSGTVFELSLVVVVDPAAPPAAGA